MALGLILCLILIAEAASLMLLSSRVSGLERELYNLWKRVGP
jgi:hypothetical protein